MADQASDAIPAVTTDVEMKVETPTEEPIHGILPTAPPVHSSQGPQADLSNAATPPAGNTSSARPGSQTPVVSTKPDKPVAHGGPTRQYLNSNVTPHLLEGMKYVAMYEPEKPLLWLSDFLRDKSAEVETSKEKIQS